MKSKWIWTFLLVGLIALARLPTQSVTANDTGTSQLTLTISGRTNLPDTNVDPDNGIEGPIISYPELNPAPDRIPGFGSRADHLMWLGILLIGTNAGVVLGRHLRKGVTAYA